MRLTVRIPLVCPGYLSDLHVYDPVTMSWRDLSTPVYGTPPAPRWRHGFTWTSSGGLYVHGGEGYGKFGL